MTREKVKIMKPIIEAFSEGKEIQIHTVKGWVGTEDLVFDLSPKYYRIKPEPKKYRPFKDQEECWQEMQKHQPFGWVKEKAGETLHLIREISDSIVTTDDIDSFKEAMNIFEFKDGTPFGIKED